jgi:hypothetical protein
MRQTLQVNQSFLRCSSDNAPVAKLDAWGRTVHLGLLREQSSTLDGVPERVVSQIPLEEVSVVEVCSLATLDDVPADAADIEFVARLLNGRGIRQIRKQLRALL